jgi:FkbM family methyltransferase
MTNMSNNDEAQGVRTAMKRQLRSALEHTFRWLPVARAAYAQRDTLQERVDALELTLSQSRHAAAAAAQQQPGRSIELLANSQALALHGGLLRLTADSPLGRGGDVILMPFDQVMLPHTVTNTGWALETLAFLEQRLDPARHYIVLDIGANVGLFTRQAALRFPNLTRFLCVEAEPGNFRALQYNLAPLPSGRTALWNVALSDADGEMRFFRDDENFGNYSLNDDAMRGRNFDAITVQSVATNRWMQEHVRLEVDEHLLWKSDTQGYDELIISLTPLDIWARVEIAIVELWRIKKPAFDRDAFAQRIDMFPHKSIGIGKSSTTAEILEFLDGDDYHHDDLYLWR